MKNISKLVLFSFCLLFGIQSQAQMGKIWYTDYNLFINIPGNGIVIIDNADVRNPKKLGYVDIIGNIDLAVNGRYLYANSHQDLVVLDIGNLEAPKEVFRHPNVFSHQSRGGNAELPSIAWNPGSNSIGGILRNVTIGNRRTSTINIGSNSSFGINPTINTLSNTSSAAPSAVSKGGSMACFTITNNYLYAIDSQDLLVFSLENPEKPIQVGSKTKINTDIETVFAYGNRLYVGAQTGMYIYDISAPENPRRMGHYRHTRSCDPVVVRGNYAFVTLRSGTECGGRLNQLDVIDITDPNRPKRIKSYNMTNPYGLGIDNDLLFVCDGSAGLKMYDASNPSNLQMKAHYREVSTFDVIPVAGKKHLILSANNEIVQYSYANGERLEQLSVFKIQ